MVAIPLCDIIEVYINIFPGACLWIKQCGV